MVSENKTAESLEENENTFVSVHKNAKKNVANSSHLDRASLVNNAYVFTYWPICGHISVVLSMITFLLRISLLYGLIFLLFTVQCSALFLSSLLYAYIVDSTG